jgi:hypothetical protein
MGTIGSETGRGAATLNETARDLGVKGGINPARLKYFRVVGY